jgi:ATP synthase protein I
MEIALSVVVGLFGGQWLDKKLHTGGWLTWVGFAYGLAAAGRAIYRAVRKSNREAEEAEQRERQARKKYADDAQDR